MERRKGAILVTGATGGIGGAIASALESRGETVVIHGRSPEKLQHWHQRNGIIPVSADITTVGGRETLIDACERAGVDTVIHSAGTLDFSMIDNQSEQAISAMVDLNLTAPILLTRRLLPLLTRGPGPTILFIGSTFSAIGHPGFAAYCATKFGLRGFAESLRRELADKNIAVHFIAPRATRTDLNGATVEKLNAELGNSSDDPAVVADMVMELLGQSRGQSRYIGWPEKLFVKINALLPRIVDGALAGKIGTIRRIAADGENG